MKTAPANHESTVKNRNKEMWLSMIILKQITKWYWNIFVMAQC